MARKPHIIERIDQTKKAVLKFNFPNNKNNKVWVGEFKLRWRFWPTSGDEVLDKLVGLVIGIGA